MKLPVVFVVLASALRAGSLLFSSRKRAIDFTTSPSHDRRSPSTFQPLHIHDGLLYSHFSSTALNSTTLAITHPTTSSSHQHPSITRHHPSSRIALFDLLSLTWACGTISHTISHTLSTTPTHTSSNNTIERASLKPLPCLLTLRSYGGGDPATSKELEQTRLIFDPRATEYVEAGEWPVVPWFGGYYFRRSSPIRPQLDLDSDEDENKDGEKEGQEEGVGITLQRTILFPNVMAGCQTITFEVTGLNADEGEVMLVLEGMEMEVYRLEGWEYGLGDVRRTGERDERTWMF